MNVQSKFAIFVPLWLIFAAAFWLLLWRGSWQTKKTWAPRLIVLGALALFGFIYWAEGPGQFVVVAGIMIGLIAFINIRALRFCPGCGALNRRLGALPANRYCSRCGARLEQDHDRDFLVTSGPALQPADSPLRTERQIESARDANQLFEGALARDRCTILLSESDLGPAFFDLRTGVAGEILQKFVNFRIPLAIVVPSPGKHGARFQELTHEHRSHPTVRFFPTENEALEWLQAKHKEL